MGLTNYRDISAGTSDVSAGFQFEFFCEKCSEVRRSAFKPYRTGQMTGWLSRFTFLVSDLGKASRAVSAFADAGSRSAKSEALAEAKQAAEDWYQRCERCNAWVGRECWDAARSACTDCLQRASTAATAAALFGSPLHTAAPAADPSPTASARCAHCQAPALGGRFCHECGFDMASTHKSCPGCGAMVARHMNFCMDCGHGF